MAKIVKWKHLTNTCLSMCCARVCVCVYTNADSFIIAKIDRRTRHKARKKNNGKQQERER